MLSLIIAPVLASLFVVASVVSTPAPAAHADSVLISTQTLADLTAETITLPLPATYQKPTPPATTPTSAQATPATPTSFALNASQYSGNGAMVTGTGRTNFTYRIEQWGSVRADLADFRAKVAATLADPRGWTRAGLTFTETSGAADLVIALSDPAGLDATAGCSGELSCTTWTNQVIINDDRWLGGTSASNAAGMSQRDYQHMVVNHEVGHWLGHYAHVESCPAGGPAPIMLQQSTGLRGCDSFNAWPLDSELWTNK